MAADERRSQIIGIAVQLFSQRGFKGTTTREIALAAGVSEAMVFRHFATKQELYTAILDFKACDTELQDPLAHLGEFINAKDDYAVFYNLSLNILRHHEEDTEFMRLLLTSALEGHELAEIFFERYIIKMYDFLGSYIESRQADGAFRGFNPKIGVRAFIGMLIHHSLNNALWDKNGRVLKMSNEAAAAEFTQILLNGVRSHGENSQNKVEK